MTPLLDQVEAWEKIAASLRLRGLGAVAVGFEHCAADVRDWVRDGTSYYETPAASGPPPWETRAKPAA